jgi:hypothetical protein
VNERLLNLVRLTTDRRGARSKRTIAIDELDFTALVEQAEQLSAGRWTKYEPADIIRGLIREHNDAWLKAPEDKPAKPAKAKPAKKGGRRG